MATWTGLTYSFGSKLTSTKMTQNQDNFLAVAEGAAGAPNIIDAAHTPITAGSTYLFDQVGFTEFISASNSYVVTTVDGDWRKIFIPRDGAYQVDFLLSNNGGAGPGTGRVYKNGVAFGTEQTHSSGIPTNQSENLTFSEGDYIELYCHGDAGNGVKVQDFKISSAVKRQG